MRILGDELIKNYIEAQNFNILKGRLIQIFKDLEDKKAQPIEKPKEPKTLSFTVENVNNKRSKLVITPEELAEYTYVTLYLGEGDYSKILIKWRVLLSDSIIANFVGEREYCVDVILRSNDSIDMLKTSISYIEHKDSFTKVQKAFYCDYNVVDAKPALEVLKSKFGEKTFYTLEEINSIITVTLGPKTSGKQYIKK